ncbi:heterokaryon incompatibility Het-C [Crepidotus variabilis]|uniref:Heterokaryon incompatibility Het-C n=1 Tax=Crepidotus variabilis TaxID=179855 RepID=A0A9P6EMH9_9AGAR|nr:heterokaryon incompatibility Het-C [Crepidotus variabilis]
MGLSPSLTNAFLLIAVLVVVLPVETYAFGAGDIPDFAYLNDKAFRHGDIENILEEVAKTAGHAALGGGSLLGIASSVLKHVSGGSKFSKSDIKKVYFGNWLRDYSQAMDIAGLSKLTADSLILVVSVLGFMTFGFATQEFEVTADRLGVYLPVEHIDNPKGYAEKEGDARKFHPKLRPPVNREELEIDEQNGMKKYMATENRGWDTSTAFIRRTFRACIEAGRRSGGNDGPDRYEAYRLLGTGLHTMEDLLAHSNWCEIALRKLGHNEVFCHVGDNVSINTPHGRAPPLVTGTFGSADFLHSLLGEAGDKISQASVTDLSQKISDAQGGQKADLGPLKAIFGKITGGGDSKMNKADQMNQQAQAYNLNPDNVAPPEVQKQLLDILRWHDDVMRDIIKRIEMVPGLETLLEEFSNAMNAYIYTLLAPYLGPLLQSATGALDEGSKMVIDSDDQYEVFNNPNAQDPSHSLLSKDHFGLILNEPAGKIAQIVVIHSTNLIVRAWSDNSNPDDVITQILEAFHHPYYATGRSDIQNKMFDQMQKWIGGMGSEATEIIASLTKEAVRDHKNKRKGLEDTEEPGYGGCGHGGGYSTGKTSGGYKNPSYGGEVADYDGGNSGIYA